MGCADTTQLGLRACVYSATDAGGTSGLTDDKGAVKCAKKVSKNSGSWCDVKVNVMKCERSCDAHAVGGGEVQGICEAATGDGGVVYVDSAAVELDADEVCVDEAP